MLTYLQVRGPDGTLRMQRLDRLSHTEQADLVHSGRVERVHAVDEAGSVVEDVLTGQGHANGRPADPPGLLAKLKKQHPKPPAGGGKPNAQ